MHVCPARISSSSNGRILTATLMLATFIIIIFQPQEVVFGIILGAAVADYMFIIYIIIFIIIIVPLIIQ